MKANLIVGIIVIESDHTAGFYKKHNAYLELLIGPLILQHMKISQILLTAQASRGPHI